MVLPDTIAACNMIKRGRKDHRLHTRQKIICIKIDDGMSTRLHISCRITTGSISFSHSIRYKNYEVFPTKNKTLNCTNEHALTQLQKARYEARKRKQRAIMES